MGSPTVTNQLEKLISTLPDGLIVHRDDLVLYANPAIAQLVGLSNPSEMVGQPVKRWVQARFIPTWQDVNRIKQVGDELPIPQEIELIHVDREVITHVEIYSARLDDWQGDYAFITVLRDLSARKAADEKIRKQANYDALTGLPNRTLFMEKLNHELIRAKRTDSRVALMFIDLDRFKWVNDNLGHSAGDELLKEVARRLLGCHRESDTVARLAGDEFTVILPDMAKGPYAERVAGEIVRQLAKAFYLEGQEAFISGSVGVTVFPDDAGNLDDLMKNADSAMYRAKTEGRNAYRFFTPDMHAEAKERMQLEKDLHKAIHNDELIIHYQPIVDLDTRRIHGAEGYIRWDRPGHGFVSPELFVPVAEETGILGVLTEKALEQACKVTERWRHKFNASDLFISMNLSCTRCRDLTTDTLIPAILERSGLPPENLVLEITETILTEDEPKAMMMLNHLAKLGVRLWLDDFGTGQSSLSVLKKLPVSGVKIDRAFVPEVLTETDTVILVESIINLAQNFKRTVIGEGVESEAQGKFLQERGCEMAQGYFFGRPLSEEEFEQMLEKADVQES
ncbi:MAG: EAL domain-containing protein [Magnetococcales bacterium]|nr:EAL domain-containing protein [Magnetococcales bacterium]